MYLREGLLIINSLQNIKIQGFKARNLIWEKSLSLILSPRSAGGARKPEAQGCCVRLKWRWP